MEKILYKNKEYNVKEYLDLMKLSPEELQGEICFLSTGETTEANNEIAVREKAIQDYMDAKKL